MMMSRGLAIAVLVLLVTSMLVGISIVPGAKAEGESWLVGWSYRKGLFVSTGIHFVTVHYGSGSDVLGHTYLNGACQADFDDVRFTSSDGVTLIDGVSIRAEAVGDYAEFKVNVPSSPIYMYYGDSSASWYYADEVLSTGSFGDTRALSLSYVTSGGGELSVIARASPVTGFATSVEAVISSDVGSTAQMALLLMGVCWDQTGSDQTGDLATVEGKRIVALTETKPISAGSGKASVVFQFDHPVPIFEDTVYGIALWAGAGTTVWYESGTGETSFYSNGGFGAVGDLVQVLLGDYAFGRVVNYKYDVDEQNVLFRDNADYTQSTSMWHDKYVFYGTVGAATGQGIGGSYAFDSTVNPYYYAAGNRYMGWGELSFKSEIADGSERFWSGVVRLSDLPGLGRHTDLVAFLNTGWQALNGFGVTGTAAGPQWELSARSESGGDTHHDFGEVEADTDYFVILSYETVGGSATSKIWVTELDAPTLLTEAAPADTLIVPNSYIGNFLFIGAADYMAGNNYPTSVFFDELTLTESFPAVFGAWGMQESLYALTVEVVGSGLVSKNPDQATYQYGDTVTLTATPTEVGDWWFAGWSGDFSSTVNPVTVIINGTTSVTATFTDENKLTINVVGNGEVTLNPTQLHYADGAVVELTAVADAGWKFSGWSGDLTGTTNPGSITMTSNKTVTATFTQDEYMLTVSTVGSGSVSKNPDQTTYHYGDVVDLTADPDVGYGFSGWSGDLTGNSNPKTITMTGNKAVTATFTLSSLVPDWSSVEQDFFDLAPGTVNPVLTAEDVTDREASLVADPFLFYEGGTWYMFLEVWMPAINSGDIGLATSSDGLTWTYQHIVLDETFHLSYPHVFKWGNTYYMIPETSEVNQVRLYRATAFPNSWELVNVLVSGPYCDSSIFRYNDLWWIFTGEGDDLDIFYSDTLTDPAAWHAHPLNPVITDITKARMAGRVVVFDSNRIIRLGQKNDVIYGQAVRAFEVDVLTTTSYSEHELPESPLVEASGSGWNSKGMHQVDPWWTGDHWLAAVDGNSVDGYQVWSIGIYQAPAYSLTVNTVGSGTVSKSPDKASYLYGDEVTLTAVEGASPHVVDAAQDPWHQPVAVRVGRD